MQTFLPFPDFRRCAEVLDDRRLGKQRVEALQILRALTVPGYAWKSHPAVLMWKGHEDALVAYGTAICEEWCRRGFADTCEQKILSAARAAGVDRRRTQEELRAAGRLPPWLGEPGLHASHRSALVRKDPARYGALFPDVAGDLPYAWPVRAPAGRPPGSAPRPRR